MRLNLIQREILKGVLYIALAVVIFIITLTYFKIYTIIGFLSYMLSFVFLNIFIAYTIDFTEIIKDTISIKYKIIDFGSYKEVKYLTSWWFLIPYWKPIKIECHSYEAENLYGGKRTKYYTTEKTYLTERDALDQIKIHKQQLKIERLKWLEYPKKNKQSIKYIK